MRQDTPGCAARSHGGASRSQARPCYVDAAGIASFIAPFPGKNLCKANQLVVAFALGIRFGMLLAKHTG